MPQMSLSCILKKWGQPASTINMRWEGKGMRNHFLMVILKL
jgi:hypothetical protein